MFGTPRVRSSTPQFAQPTAVAATARRTVTPVVPTARPALQRRVAGDSPARPAVFNAPHTGAPTAAMAGGPGTLSLLRVRVAQALAALDACMGPDVSRGEEHLRGEVVRAVQQWLERQPATLRPSALIAEPQPASTVTVRRTQSTASAPSAVATPHEKRLTPAFGEDASASMPASPLLTAGTWTSQVTAATRALGSLTIQRRVRLDTLGALLASLRRLEPELSRTTMSDTDPFVASAQKLLPLLTFQLQALDAQVTRAVCEVLELLVRCVGPLLRPAALHNAASKLLAAWTAPQQVAAAEPIGRAINVIVAATKDAATLLPLLCELLDAPRNDITLARLPAAARLGVYLLDDAVSRGEIQRVHVFLAKERMFSRTDFVVPYGVPLSALRRAAATRWLAAEEDVVLLSATTGEPIDVEAAPAPHPLTAAATTSQSAATVGGGSPSRSSSHHATTASPFRSTTPSLDPRRGTGRDDISFAGLVPPSMRAHSVERTAGGAPRTAAVSLERLWGLAACLSQPERAHTALPLLYALFPEETAAKVAAAGSRERRALLQALHAEPAFGICITHPVLLPEAFDAPYLLDPGSMHPDGALVPPGPKRRVPTPAQVSGLGFSTSAASRAQRGPHIVAPALSLPPDMRPAHSQQPETRSIAGVSRGASVSFAGPPTSSVGGGECAVVEFALPPRRGSVGVARRSVAPSSAPPAPQSASSPLDFAVR